MWAALTCAFVVGIGGVASAAPNPCVNWLKSKEYEKAATCFLRAFDALKAKGVNAEPTRVKAGRTLRNAALAFHFASKKSKSLDQKGWLLSRAIMTLDHYLKGKWYENKHRKTRTELLRFKLQKALQLTPLTLLPQPTKLSYTLVGYKTKQKHKGSWSGLVRPGRYKISYVSVEKTTQHTLTVVPGKAKIFSFRMQAADKQVATRGHKATPHPQTPNPPRRPLPQTQPSKSSAGSLQG